MSHDHEVTHLLRDGFRLTAMPVEADGERPDLHVTVDDRDEPLVSLWQEASDGAELEMTAAEAREVADALYTAANRVDGLPDDYEEIDVQIKVVGRDVADRNLRLYVEWAQEVCGCRKPKSV